MNDSRIMQYQITTQQKRGTGFQPVDVQTTTVSCVIEGERGESAGTAMIKAALKEISK